MRQRVRKPLRPLTTPNRKEKGDAFLRRTAKGGGRGLAAEVGGLVGGRTGGGTWTQEGLRLFLDSNEGYLAEHFDMHGGTFCQSHRRSESIAPRHAQPESGQQPPLHSLQSAVQSGSRFVVN